MNCVEQTSGKSTVSIFPLKQNSFDHPSFRSLGQCFQTASAGDRRQDWHCIFKDFPRGWRGLSSPSPVLVQVVAYRGRRPPAATDKQRAGRRCLTRRRPIALSPGQLWHSVSVRGKPPPLLLFVSRRAIRSSGDDDQRGPDGHGQTDGGRASLVLVTAGSPDDPVFVASDPFFSFLSFSAISWERKKDELDGCPRSGQPRTIGQVPKEINDEDVFWINQ